MSSSPKDPPAEPSDGTPERAKGRPRPTTYTAPAALRRFLYRLPARS